MRGEAQEVVVPLHWRSRIAELLLTANLPVPAPGHRPTAPARSMWKGSSRSLFRTLVLENSKFLLFVLTPVFTASLFWNDSVVDYIVRSRQYVTYPPEGERPPTTREEVRARHAELRARLDAQAEAEGRRRGAGAAGAG